MTKQITLEEALELVQFYQYYDGTWHVNNVLGDVWGDVYGSVEGSIKRHVGGTIGGTINGREWQYVETPKEKFIRLLAETHNQELIDAFNQLENN